VKNITWPQVAVIFIVVAGVVTLAALGRDTTVLVALGGLVLTGIGLIAGSQQGIKDNTNGNMTRLLSMVESMANQLALAPPPLPPIVDGEVVDDPPPAPPAPTGRKGTSA
jgi:hypothetical protein